jgi:hypothetical protein
VPHGAVEDVVTEAAEAVAAAASGRPCSAAFVGGISSNGWG